MGKVSEVEIPEGSGRFYRYEYVDGKTLYRGPVGSAPELNEEDFLKFIDLGTVKDRGDLFRRAKGSYRSPDGRKVKVFAKYGFATVGDQEPYFSITAEAGNKYIGWSSGMNHDEILKAMPELSDLTRWHLAFIERGPMHYVSNSKYFWERRELGSFMDTIVFGALPDDEMSSISEAMEEDADTFLAARKPRLMEQFRKDMERFEVPIPEGY